MKRNILNSNFDVTKIHEDFSNWEEKQARCQSEETGVECAKKIPYVEHWVCVSLCLTYQLSICK